MYSYPLMVKSVSCCCVREIRLFSNLVTFKLSKWRQRFSIKAIMMYCVMDTRFELQYKTVAGL